MWSRSKKSKDDSAISMSIRNLYLYRCLEVNWFIMLILVIGLLTISNFALILGLNWILVLKSCIYMYQVRYHIVELGYDPTRHCVKYMYFSELNILDISESKVDARLVRINSLNERYKLILTIDHLVITQYECCGWSKHKMQLFIDQMHLKSKSQ